MVPSRLDRVLEALSTAGVFASIALLVAVWNRLPERVPTHFGMSGAPDAWGSRTSLLLFVIAPLTIHVGLTVLSRLPWVYNYPVKVSEENVERLYTLGRRFMEWLRTEMVWMLVLVGWLTIRVALRQAEGVGLVPVLGPLVAIYGTGTYFVVAMVRASKKAVAPSGL
ncbi:MAG: DUF1648 domain-containing protein [Bacteroidota bacterium]